MKSKQKLILTRAQLKKMLQKQTVDGLILFIATAMDEFDWDMEDIERFSIRLNRYANAVDEHLISINKVKEIVKEVIGVEFG